jgi:DNA-binding beta-propeller fold protein YncE
MKRRRKLVLAGILLALIAALGAGQAALDAKTQAGAVDVPLFEVDPFWPRPLPDNWVLGSAIGVAVDSRDHVYVIHRPESVNPATEGGAGTDPPTSSCCIAAPNILVFDPDGHVVDSWGGPGEGYEWPSSNHGIGIDHKDNVWIGGNGARDSHILKFTRDGRFLLQIGAVGQAVNSHARDHFGRVAKIAFDATANEAFLADGYGNRRVAVIDMDTGVLLRYWGAYGNEPDDTNPGPYDPDAPPAPQFRTPVHCAEPTNDGLIYVCDRPNNRIQVFRRDGTFVMEQRIAPRTLGDGAVWDIAFSRDPQQRFLYLADGKNMKVHVIDRASLQVLTSFGDGGRQPGQFFAVHSIATDSDGNIYTTETYEGKRIQKFVYKGMGTVTRRDQGVLWPARGGSR